MVKKKERFTPPPHFFCIFSLCPKKWKVEEVLDFGMVRGRGLLVAHCGIRARVCVLRKNFFLSLRSVTLVCLYLTYSSSSFPPFFAPPPLDSSTTSETTRKWKFKAGGVSSTPPLGEEENESKVAEPSDWASSCMLVAVHSRLSSVCVVKFLLLTRYS